MDLLSFGNGSVSCYTFDMQEWGRSHGDMIVRMSVEAALCLFMQNDIPFDTDILREHTFERT